MRRNPLNHSGPASFATAQKIVDLLRNDPGVASLDGRPPQSYIGAMPEVHVCRGCGIDFKPKTRVRQFCSTNCWEAYRARTLGAQP